METIYRNFGDTEYRNAAGAMFIEYDAHSDDEPLTCEDCGATAYDGFLCLDGGETLCGNCVTIVPAFLGRSLSFEYDDCIAHKNRLVHIRCLIGNAFLESFATRHAPGKYLGWVAPL